MSDYEVILVECWRCGTVRREEHMFHPEFFESPDVAFCPECVSLLGWDKMIKTENTDGD